MSIKMSKNVGLYSAISNSKAHLHQLLNKTINLELTPWINVKNLMTSKNTTYPKKAINIIIFKRIVYVPNNATFTFVNSSPECTNFSKMDQKIEQFIFSSNTPGHGARTSYLFHQIILGMRLEFLMASIIELTHHKNRFFDLRDKIQKIWNLSNNCEPSLWGEKIKSITNKKNNGTLSHN